MKIEIKHKRLKDFTEGFIEIDVCDNGVTLDVFDEKCINENLTEEEKTLHRIFGKYPHLNLKSKEARLLAKYLNKFADIHDEMNKIERTRENLKKRLDIYSKMKAELVK